jgi:competence protein ComEC
VALVLAGLGLQRLAGVDVPWPVLAAEETPPVRVDFLDVGHGHAAFVRAGATALLVDGGGPGAGPGLVAWLQGQGVTRLDGVVLTSPADATAGGLIPVLEALPVGRLYDAGWAADCALYRSLLTLARHRAIPVQRLASGDAVTLAPGARLEALLPPPGAPPAAGDGLVLRLVAGNVALLLAAALGPGQEAALLRSGAPLRADVLELPRQGAAGSLAPGLLEAVRPRLAVVSVPAGDPTLPDAAVVGRLAAAGVPLLRSDAHGSVAVTTDGRALAIRLEPSPGQAGEGGGPMLSCTQGA